MFLHLGHPAASEDICSPALKDVTIGSTRVLARKGSAVLKASFPSGNADAGCFQAELRLSSASLHLFPHQTVKSFRGRGHIIYLGLRPRCWARIHSLGLFSHSYSYSSFIGQIPHHFIPLHCFWTGNLP